MSSLLPSGVRHRRPWGEHSRGLRVPLWYEKAEGEYLEGKIQVPKRLAFAAPDTNERHEFDNLISYHLRRWAEWRETKGWTMATTPKVSGPFKPPGEEEPEMYWYFAKARFKRVDPLYMKLDDFLGIHDLAERQKKAPKVKDSGWVNPLEWAEQRRQAMGVKREEYLTGPLNEPNAPPPEPPSGVQQVAIVSGALGPE